jgi:hypothetical protein
LTARCAVKVEKREKANVKGKSKKAKGKSKAASRI